MQEVERSAAKALGISPDVFFGGDDGSFGSLATNFVNPIEGASSFAGIFGGFDAGNFSVDLLLDAMEKKGIATILAEPTLIATNGESASFLAGGEFPVPAGTIRR